MQGKATFTTMGQMFLFVNSSLDFIRLKEALLHVLNAMQKDGYKGMIDMTVWNVNREWKIRKIHQVFLLERIWQLYCNVFQFACLFTQEVCHSLP